ncbi:hypothetical protein [Enterococcus sp. AZ196]|uniref:hypothetical protein n=1 Tax=Enterococcus sp. AZ196 TaxID=2774659 RepID=UPI003D2A8D17
MKSDFNLLILKVDANKRSATDGINHANDRIDRINSRLSTTEIIQNLVLERTNELYRLHNTQQTSLDSHSANIKQIYGLINDQGAVLGRHTNSINQLYQLRNEHQAILERHSESLNSAGLKISELYRLNDDQGVVLGKHTNSINQLYQLRNEHQAILERHSESLNSAGSKISELYQLHNLQQGSLDSHSKLINSHTEKLNTNQAQISQLYQLHNTQQDSLDSHSALLTGHSASILQLYQLHNAQQESIDKLKAELLGVVAAIVKASSDNVGLWDAEHYDGGSISEKDGKAVRLFKNQFQESRSHFALIMKHYFDMNDKESAIYRLRYSIVAGFEETKELMTEWFVIFLESQNTTNKLLKVVSDWLQMQHGQLDTIHNDLVYLLSSQNVINTNLSTIIRYLALQEEHFKTVELYAQFIISWLADIYEKIGTEDSSGWIRELIQTIGSILETAIKTLGSVLETAINEVTRALKEVLSFLDNLLDKIIHLIVPENLDFMQKKFDSTGETIKSKFPFIFGWIDSFKSLFGGQAKVEDQNFDLNGMFEGEVKLPFSKLNDFAPYIRGFVTGFVLLGFLIDMYHWFHSRGEVIE